VGDFWYIERGESLPLRRDADRGSNLANAGREDLRVRLWLAGSQDEVQAREHNVNTYLGCVRPG